MAAKPRRSSRANVLEEEDDRDAVGTFEVPAILLDEDSPAHFECDAEIVSVSVGKAQEGVGFSWIGDCKPSDIPTPAEVLARYGPGHYKLTGKCIDRKIRKHRILSVGDWKPAGVAPTPAAAAPQLPSGSPAAGMISFLSTIAAIVTPLVVPVLAYMRETSSAARNQVQEANNRLLEAMTTLGGARTSDLESLLKAAIANLGPQGGASSPAGSNKVWLELLEIQRTVLTKAAKEGSSGEDLMALAMAMFGGYNETRRAEAEARLAEIRARNAPPVTTVDAHGEPAPPTHTVIVGPDGKPPPVAPQANGASGSA